MKIFFVIFLACISTFVASEDPVALNDTAELVEIKELKEDMAACVLPSQRGPCFKFRTRFYYDQLYKRCEKFLYGGCLGNRNNFQTLDRCEMACENEQLTEDEVET